MSDVKLKSRVGPVTLTIRQGYTKREAVFDFDNDCRSSVPRDWWERTRDELFDRDANWRYREAFIEL
jgi:hypothetical protein